MNNNQNQRVEALPEHCILCFEVLVRRLTNGDLNIWNDNLVDHSCPLFVTWYINQDEDLRGCIGTFASNPLSQNLPQFALQAGFSDNRFKPIRKDEIQKLTVGVSLLYEFQWAKNAQEWEVGQHGIEIEFIADNQRFSGTFLPEVMPDQGWNKEEALRALIKKAGYNGPLENVIQDMKLKTYKSSKYKMPFSEYHKICQNSNSVQN